MAGLEGSHLGAYELVQRIGGGGMAEVYRARQSTAFGREVAIKVIRAGFSEDTLFRERFLREAQAISKLSHPNILPLIEFGEQNQTLYLVMPLAREGTLRDLLKQHTGPRPLEEAIPLFSQLCDAVHYAHEHGIIHRDLKPQNVLMQQRTHVLLADFGIARDSAETQLTATGAGLGTVEYMAPEQAIGQADARSDIYSLGIMLYQLLTGMVPFSGTTPFQILMKHTNAPLPDPRTLNPGLSNDLVEVLKAALAKDPGQRFQSALALKRSIQQASKSATAASFAVPAVQPPVPGEATSQYGTVSAAAPAQPTGQTLNRQTELPAPSPDNLTTAPGVLPAPLPPTGFPQPSLETQGPLPAPGGWAASAESGASYDLPTWGGTQGGFPPAPGGGGPHGPWRGGLPPSAGDRPVPQPPPRKRPLGLVALVAALLIVLLCGSLIAFGFGGAGPLASLGAKTARSVSGPTATTGAGFTMTSGPSATTPPVTATVPRGPTATPTRPPRPPTATPTRLPTATPTPPAAPPGQLTVSPTGLGENCAALSDFLTLSNTGGQAVSWSGSSSDANFVVGPNSGTLAPGAQVSVQVKGGDPMLAPGDTFSVFFKWSGPTITVTVTCK